MNGWHPAWVDDLLPEEYDALVNMLSRKDGR